MSPVQLVCYAVGEQLVVKQDTHWDEASKEHMQLNLH